jgi:tetratricopeptide (TPR) repeat protein
MDAVTYPDERVVEFIQKSLVPLLVAFDAKPLASDFNIKWTPTLITLGSDGREHHRTVGFLDPEGFIANALLGIGKFHFDNERHEEALALFDTIIADFGKSDVTAETVFLQGVARYKKSGDPAPLKTAYETLTEKYPDSEWTKRAYPYRLL